MPPPTKQWLEENCKNTGRFDLLWENVNRYWEIVEKSGPMIAQLQQDLDRQKEENDALQEELAKQKKAATDAKAQAKKAQEELAKQKRRMGGRIDKLTDKVKEQAAKLAKGVKVITKFSKEVVTKTVERVWCCGRIVTQSVSRYRDRHSGRSVRYHKM